MRATTILLITFAATAFTAPQSPLDRHRRQTSVTVGECSAEDTWWAAGHVYRYRYTGRLDTGLQTDVQALPLTTALTIACDVHIKPQQACQHQMTVSKCSLLQHSQDGSVTTKQPESRKLTQSMNRYPVLFQSSGGLLEDSIQVHAKEPITVVNLKRGILSALQLRKDITYNSVDSIEQVSVHGNCPTKYSSEEELGSTKVHTKVQVSLCSGTRNIEQMLPFVRLEGNIQDAILQVMQPKNASLECSHTLDEDDQLSSVECQERHLLRTFSGHTVMEANIRQSVNLVETTPSPTESLSERRNMQTTTLQYELGENSQPQQSATRETMQNLQELVQTSLSQTETPSTNSFKKLIGSLRKLSLSSLGQVVRKVSICRMWYCSVQNRDLLQSLFYDALAACGTGSCVKALTGVINGGDISGRDVRALLLGVAVSQAPTRAALRGLLSICQCSGDSCGASPSQCILPLSIMVHKYSQQTDPQQESRNSPVLQSVGLLKQLIGDDCQPSISNIASNDRQAHSNLVLTALQALANMGQSVIAAYDSGLSEDSQVIPALQKCISNKALPFKIPIAAIKVLQGVSQSSSVVPSLLAVMEDNQTAVEVRSAAYLGLMQAPDMATMRRVVSMMKTESIRQMKAFLKSNMQTILVSVDPKLHRTKKLLRTALLQAGIVLPPADLPSYGLSHSLNIGNEDVVMNNQSIHDHLVADIVYGTGSLVPTHNNIKVMLDVSGEHVNIAELGLDWQGFDFLGGSLFKSDATPDASFSHFHQAVVQQLEELHSQIQHAHNNPEATLKLALFGYNLGSVSINQLGFLGQLSEVQTTDQLWQILNMDTLASSLHSGIKRHLSKAFLLPILEEVIPTALGIPLSLTLDGTAMMQAQLDLSLGLGTIIRSFQDLDNLEISGQLKLSGIGDIQSKLTANIVGLASTGVQHQSEWQAQLNSKTSIRSNIQGLQLQLTNLPGSQQVLQSSTKMGLIQNENYQEVTQPSQTTPEPALCMLSFVDKLTGWNLCGQQVAPTESNDSPTVERLALRLWNFISSKIPLRVKDMAGSLFTFSDNALTLLLPLPALPQGSSAQPASWVGYLQTVWQSVRAAAIQPPHQYTAMIFGNKHIYTFDGLFYEFPDYPSDECTYVLARDFVDRNFTILRTKDTVTVLTRDIAITIDHNNKVKVNNSDTYSDLPLQSWNGNVTVTRSGPSVTLATDYGLTVKCRSQASQCIISISGWYHNRTLGLLGTNDNEPSNDFRMRDGTVTRNMQQFVNSFEVSGMRLCRPNPEGEAMQQGPNLCVSQNMAQCGQLFQDSTSPLSACFSKVNPQPFKEACELDMKKCGSNSAQTTVCPTSEAYAALCQSWGVKVTQPSQCGSCSEHASGTTWKLRGSRKADIVLVTSLHTNISTTAGKQPSQFLHSLVHGLRHILHRSGGVRDVQFGLVAYDGQGVQSAAHTHTIRGEVFADQQTAHHLKHRLQSLHANGAVASSALGAISMATDYPFRPQAAKIVLLLTSTDVEHLPTEANMTSLVQLQNKLQSSGVTLDVLSEYEELSQNSVLGLQWDGRIVQSRHQQSADNTNMDFPQGDYAQLASSTQGAVFDLSLVAGGTLQQRRQFSRTVQAQVMAHSQLCYQCTCSLGAEGQGLSRCQSTDCSNLS